MECNLLRRKGSGQVFSRSILEQVAGCVALVRRTHFLIPAICLTIENVESILLCIYHDLRLWLFNKAAVKEMRQDKDMLVI